MKPKKLLIVALIVSVNCLEIYLGGDEVDEPGELASNFLDLPRIKSKVKKVLPAEKPLMVPVQQGRTLGESILDLKHSRVSKSQLRRNLNRLNKVSTTSTSIPTTSLKEESSVPVETSVKVESKKSWIAYFLASKPPETLQPATTHSLHSNIINYQDMVSDNKDLSAWTRFVVEEDTGTVAHKQYGIPQTKVINIDEFIEYLTKYHGFRLKDLLFLKNAELDYGLEEIERELNKIKERQDLEIVIGGEPPDVATSESSSLHVNVYYIYLVFLLLLF